MTYPIPKGKILWTSLLRLFRYVNGTFPEMRIRRPFRKAGAPVLFCAYLLTVWARFVIFEGHPSEKSEDAVSFRPEGRCPASSR